MYIVLACIQKCWLLTNTTHCQNNYIIIRKQVWFNPDLARCRRHGATNKGYVSTGVISAWTLLTLCVNQSIAYVPFLPCFFFLLKCTRKFSEIYCHQSHVNAMYTWKFSEIYCHQFHVNTLYFNRFEFFKLKWKAPGSWKVSDLRLKFNYLLLAINSITEISC